MPSPRSPTPRSPTPRTPGSDPRPAVIILDILDGSLIIPRILAHTLATSGIDACIMIMPHYGPRRATQGPDLIDMTETPEILIKSVQQAVTDIRRTARFCAALPQVDPDRIGLTGTSLGGIIASLAAGVDGAFPRVVTVIAAADLTTILTTNAAEVAPIKDEFRRRHLNLKQVRALVEPIEPLNFADRLENTNLLMINASADRIIPARCARQFARTSGAQIRWFKTDHYGMAQNLPQTLGLITRHFAPAQW